MQDRGVQSTVLVGAGAALLLLASIWFPWTSRGTGARLPLGELVSFATGTPDLAPRWVAMSAAALPLAGAALVVAAWRGWPMLWVPATTGATAILLMSGLWRAGGSGIGLGAWYAAAGTVLAGVASGLGRGASRALGTNTSGDEQFRA